MPDQFEFGFPWVFALAPLPILIIWLLPALRHHKTTLRAPFFEELVAISGQSPGKGVRQTRRRVINAIALWLSWLLVIVALASPQLVGEPELEVKTTRNFLVAADLSFSMAQKDWTIDGQRVTRWEAVKHVLADFIDKREGDRMGLVLFGSNAYTQVPFTADLDLMTQLIEEADVGMAGQQTNIGQAIGQAIELFDRDTIETKVLLLFTDGVDSGTGTSPLDAASLAREDSVKIYTLGIGDPSKPGADLDEETLKEIASDTGGRYFLAMDSDQLAQVYEEIGRLEPIEYEEEVFKPKILLFYYPLGAVFALTVLLFFIQSLMLWMRVG